MIDDKKIESFVSKFLNQEAFDYSPPLSRRSSVVAIDGHYETLTTLTANTIIELEKEAGHLSVYERTRFIKSALKSGLNGFDKLSKIPGDGVIENEDREQKKFITDSLSKAKDMIAESMIEKATGKAPATSGKGVN